MPNININKLKILLSFVPLFVIISLFAAIYFMSNHKNINQDVTQRNAANTDSTLQTQVQTSLQDQQYSLNNNYENLDELNPTSLDTNEKNNLVSNVNTAQPQTQALLNEQSDKTAMLPSPTPLPIAAIPVADMSSDIQTPLDKVINVDTPTQDPSSITDPNNTSVVDDLYPPVPSDAVAVDTPLPTTTPNPSEPTATVTDPTITPIAETETPSPAITDTPSPSVSSDNPASELDITQVKGVSSAAKIVGDKTVKILMYHYIRDYKNQNDKVGESLSVSPKNFEKQMNELSTDGYNSILFSDVLVSIQNNKPLPNNPVIISFDDGYDNHYDTALPILVKYKFKGTFAIATGLVGKPSYMSWDQIKFLKSQGNEVVSHTVSHPHLAQLSYNDIVKELDESKKMLDKTLGQDTKTIVYPYGSYNNNVLKIAKTLGYAMGRTTRPGSVASAANIMTLPANNILDSSDAANIKVVNSPVFVKDVSEPKGTLVCPAYSNNQTIQLVLTATDDDNLTSSLQMQVSNEPTFNNIGFENFSATKNWLLTPGEGIKNVFVRYIDPSGNKSASYSCNTTVDTHPSTLSNIAVKPSTDNINITLTSSEQSSIKAEIGLDSKYGKTQNATVQDKILNYSIKIDGLLRCTSYHYKITSEDVAHNITSTNDAMFITDGCIGASKVNNATTSVITPATGGNVKIEDGKNNLSLNIPSNFSSTQASFQLNNVENINTLNTTGKPKDLSVVSNHIFEIKALKDLSTPIHQFDKAIEVQMSYKDDNIKTFDTGTLQIYRWDDSVWTPLGNCHNDLNTSSIVCNTNNFSIFALFVKSNIASIDSAANIITGTNNIVKAIFLLLFIAFDIALIKFVNKKNIYRVMDTLKLRGQNN